MTYPIPGEPEEFEQRLQGGEPDLDPEELSLMARRDIQILEKANRTITNLIRKEPIVYMGVARNALIRSLEKEKIQLEIRNRDLLDKLAAVKTTVREARPAMDTLLLVRTLNQILGED